ncbi:MAG TPA: FkbM family methyltransferase [Candidatus Paceibacterota bacterium]|nr:FkbM family methyltransferase [Candidatus Paceibacterota bacterium]
MSGSLRKYLTPKNYLRYGARVLGLDYRKSYAQNGEDILIDFIFRALKTQHPSYIDIGAHDPIHKSNTALFYRRGSRGINVEANPLLFKRFLRKRPGDINLNIGIAPQSGTLDFYVMNNPGLSTFSKEEAERLVREHGYAIASVYPVEVRTFRDVIDQYADGTCPDLLTIDTEGLDEEILRSIDFTAHRPKVICVETISFSRTRDGIKDEKLIGFLKEQGYTLIADTYINSLFVDARIWKE